MLEYILAAIVFLVLAVVVWEILKKLAEKALALALNSFAGLLVLMLMNHLLGWDIPIGVPTLVVCGLFGVPGVGALIVLHYFSMI